MITYITPEHLNVGKYTDLTRKRDRILYRSLEIMPGLLALTTLGIVIAGSFAFPTAVAIFIIVFDVYWLVKSIFLSLHLNAAFRAVRENLKRNWRQALERLPRERYSIRCTHWSDVWHLVILPFSKEDEMVVRETIEAITRSDYPKNRLIVILSAEERAGTKGSLICEKMQSEYGRVFAHFIATIHPAALPGEITGKGANSAWAGAQAKALIDRIGINTDRIIVSVLDIDTIVPLQYFLRVTHAFLTTEEPLRASYQPIPFYINNIWEAGPFARVVAFSATNWHMLQQERPERITTFSSHSMPYSAWSDAGFGQRNIVSEDSRIFWNCFLYYNGNYRVVPLHYPVSMDANVAPSFWRTMTNIYKQQRRWSWGVENIPYFLFGFWKNKNIPKGKKWYYGFAVIEGFWSWSTNALLIFLLGWLPVFVGGPEFQRTILSFNLPTITRWIMTVAMVGLASQAVITLLILPQRPPNFGRLKYLWICLQWLLFPVTAIVFGALPGLDSQIRLMLGKYMGFWVTRKIRGNPKTHDAAI